MRIFKKVADLQHFLQQQKENGRQIGFIPTMGALHDGHLSLIKAANDAGNFTVCSVFVNPTQFNDPRDFEHYPITIEADIEKLLLQECQVLFLPSVSEMYPQGKQQQELYDLGYLEQIWEGAYRPGHFQGVCQVVDRFLDIVKPDYLYLGQKDYQQCMVISRLLELKNLPVQMVIQPTIRETDGLAMSSRNMRLNETQRRQAVNIYHTLLYIKQHLAAGDTHALLQAAEEKLTAGGLQPDYISLADATTLLPVTNWDGDQPLVTLVAAWLGPVRLIDNMILD